MDKNLLLAVVLSAGFLMAWYYFFQPRPIAQSPLSTDSKKLEEATGAPSKREAAEEKKETALSREIKKKPVLLEKEKIIDTTDAKVVIHSRGAAIQRWYLKEKLGKENSASPEKYWPDIVNHRSQSNGTKKPNERLPLSTFPELNFEEIKTVKEGKLTRSIWKTVLPSGIELEKEYQWEDDSHFFKIFLSFRNPTKSVQTIPEQAIGWSGGLGTIESELKENLSNSRAVAYPSPTKEILNFKETQELKWNYSWAGVDNRYYLFAMLPAATSFDTLLVKKDKKNFPELYLANKNWTLHPGEQKSLELPCYLGPKGYAQLRQWGKGLEQAVNFGYFGFLGKWALRSLYFLYGWTKNYGWAIILLTCALQVLVFPLNLKSYKSMAAMKKLQPRLAELQKRYKDDPKRLNQEMLNLYKESKTNPFGGCLPMLLQIPIFWAFFTMLRGSYELRGAPWILWIKDLSQQDPYYILPIVMGAGMFLQQKISGTTGDPTQAKIMLFMPVIFTFLFLTFPSGLVLYWLTNSILSMLTQYWCNKKFAPQNPQSGRLSPHSGRLSPQPAPSLAKK